LAQSFNGNVIETYMTKNVIGTYKGKYVLSVVHLQY